MAAATATQEAFWLQFLLEEMCLNIATLIVVKEDNKACISFADHPGKEFKGCHSYGICDHCGSDCYICTKVLNAVNFIKFKDCLVVSRSRLNIVKKVEKRR